MTDETTQIAGNATPTPESFDSAESAAAFMIDRDKQSPAESADPATADPELAVEANADPLEAAPGEDEDVDPASKEPPIERPKSWTESEEAEWQSTPRALQQKIAARELERDTALRRAQNEAAEKLKGLTAKEQQADEARQRYEAKLPEVMQQLTDHNNRQFADIKSVDDLKTLANEALRLSTTDPVAAGQIQAYLQAWQVHQQAMAATKAELDQTNARKQDETRKEAIARKTREHSLLIEKAPEFADQKRLDAAQKAAVEMFREKGFGDDDLMKIGDDPIFDDHRMQLIVNDALKFRALEAAKASVTAKVAPKTLPPVQRPGVSRPASAGNSERIQALESKLNNSGSEEDAFALLMARRNAAARRAS